MQLHSTSTGLTITNPLVLYRALIATKRIDPDPSQHRLALHLQKLYERLKDYEPTVEYRDRLDQIGHTVNAGSTKDSGRLQDTRNAPPAASRGGGIWASLLAQKEKRENLALTRVLTDREAAIALSSPKGLMLHGEVGTGKSMLIDLFADCLPNRKKRRWHFNTFMLETFAKLEQLRRSRVFSPVYVVPETSGQEEDDYSLLWLARDMISTSPILFLDEFQLPDRAASKIITNLMTSFFQLGGVLIATSNRMPEELAKAAGMEFSPPPSRLESLGWRFGRAGRKGRGRSDNMFGGQGEFAGFLELLKARCEVWEMEGGRDYRRRDVETGVAESSRKAPSVEEIGEGFEGLQDLAPGNIGLGYEQSVPIPPSSTESAGDEAASLKILAPHYFFIRPSSGSSSEIINAWLHDYNTTLHRLTSQSAEPTDSIPWTPSTMRVYGRIVPIPRQIDSITSWTFSELCGTNLGPADYITLASRYHTVILTDVPVLTLLQKNEARRFITLLDALYEARCKLMITAEAGPDDIFFPEARPSSSSAGMAEGQDQDATYAETFSDIYQDASAPFRPNISSYTPSEPDTTHARLAGLLAPDALEDDPPNRVRRVNTSYNSTPNDPANAGFDADEEAEQRAKAQRRQALNFSQSGIFTGEDERFAYKRARSRLWEMCSRRWWAREEPGWHRPVAQEVRRWEGIGESSHLTTPAVLGADALGAGMEGEGAGRSAPVDEKRDEVLFQHAYNASPFRTSREPPPRFGVQHAWGMMKWGRKAGAWGQGVEGLKERGRETAKEGKSGGEGVLEEKRKEDKENDRGG